MLIGSGLTGGALLALFFLSGSILTFRKQHPTQHTGRSARQVLANGMVAALGSACLALGFDAGWPLICGGLAAAQADTWATEVGLEAPYPPRLVTTFAQVPPGTSGAITLRGTMAGALGAAAMTALAVALGVDPPAALSGGLGGGIGFIADSYLGATLQASYYCRVCDTRTESSTHSCGRSARLESGLSWLDNDAVNVASTSIGGFAALAIHLAA